MKRPRILLVEDNSTDAHLIQRIFNKEEFEPMIHWVKNGEEALNFLKDPSEKLPKAVLLDIKLPKVGGMEVLKTIKEDAQFKSIPVIMYSSSAQTSDMETAYALGANSYLVKPQAYQEMKKLFHEFVWYWFSCNTYPFES